MHLGLWLVLLASVLVLGLPAVAADVGGSGGGDCVSAGWSVIGFRWDPLLGPIPEVEIGNILHDPIPHVTVTLENCIEPAQLKLNN